jgi:hypothetical protein
VKRVLRIVAAIVVSGVVGAVLFLIMTEGSFRQGYTDFEYSHVLGTAISEAAEEPSRSTEPFAVVGDTAGPLGLDATVIAAIVLMAFHALVIDRLVRRHWAIQGLVLGAVTALVVGLVFCGIADARLDTPIGLFGADADGMAPVVLVLSSLAFGLVGARCYSLIASPSWWVPREEDVAAQVEIITEIVAEDDSLELAEEGSEKGRVGT